MTTNDRVMTVRHNVGKQGQVNTPNMASLQSRRRSMPVLGVAHYTSVTPLRIWLAYCCVFIASCLTFNPISWYCIKNWTLDIKKSNSWDQELTLLYNRKSFLDIKKKEQMLKRLAINTHQYASQIRKGVIEALIKKKYILWIYFIKNFSFEKVYYRT